MFDEFSGVNILLMADFQGTKVLITSFQIPKDIAFYFRYKSALIISVRVEGGLICLLVRLLQLASSPSLSVLESWKAKSWPFPGIKKSVEQQYFKFCGREPVKMQMSTDHQ